MNDAIIIALTSIISSLLTVAALYFVFLKPFSENTEKQSKVTEDISNIGTSLSTQVSNVRTSIDNQMSELRALQDSLKDKQQETQDLLANFTDIITLKPSARGSVGEGIVRWSLGLLPDSWWDEQVTIGGGRIDFLVNLTDDHQLLIDSKFSYPEEMIRVGATDFLNENEIRKLNKSAVKRSKELTKYIEGSNGNNLNFVLMYVPGVIYSNLDNNTYQAIYNNKVIPVDNSGLLSTILIVRRLIQMIQYEKAQEKILHIRESIPTQFKSINDELGTLQKHLKNATNKLTDLESIINSSETNLLKTFVELENNVNR